jgi:hypothetical protein
MNRVGSPAPSRTAAESSELDAFPASIARQVSLDGRHLVSPFSPPASFTRFPCAHISSPQRDERVDFIIASAYIERLLAERNAMFQHGGPPRR